MNLFFGKIARNNSMTNAKSRMEQHLAEHSSASPSFEVVSESILAGFSKTGEYVMGTARQGKYLLMFNGFFFEPFPVELESPALESPNLVARVLLERFLKTGPDFMDGLLGYYSLAVINTENSEVLLASDPYGQRSIFIHEDNDSISFGSNLSATALLIDSPRVDRSWEDFFLIYGFYPYGNTLVANMKAIPPGKLVSWKSGKQQIRDIKPYQASSDSTLKDGAQLAEAIEVLHDGFMKALSQQSGDAKNVGVLLGGFDSALVAAGLKKLGKNVTTWSFYYDQEEYNQPHTEELAKFLGIRHHWVRVTQSDIEKGIEEFPFIFNQPTNWPNYVIQTALLMEKMRDAGVSLAYSGDGCDTVFLGYPGTWRRARVIERIPSLPKPLAKAMSAVLARPLLERKLGHPYRVALNLVRTSAWPRHVRGFLSFRILDEISLRQIRGSDVPPQKEPIETTVSDLAASHASMPSLRLAYLGKSLVSPNKNKMNGSSDLTGIPILSPYMHPEFKRLAQSLPEELCRPNEATASRITGKYALMKMAEEKGLLPHSVIYQKKMAAVDAPIDDWYAGPMREFMLRQFESLPFTANQNYLESLLEPHLAEQLFQKHLLTDKVIKHAPSLLVTYARFCRTLHSFKKHE